MLRQSHGLTADLFHEVLTNGAGQRIYAAILINHDPYVNSSNETEQILYSQMPRPAIPLCLF
jgi:hypothetical protein